eukprot:TRINITY_DN7579_c0_g2_i1.p1 TRINITY_DN7579_c0_g2~~TRINITY_DN7579_c0_g2_i1.p1  ORF type:complete len:157 (+),score=33.08 TRINITY_DN7579_c0_g2_i1:440-910(+)
MSWPFLLWLISFLVVAALLGIVMYMLICLSDLENDFINPHDSTLRINKFLLPEMVLQGSLTALYLVTGRWFMFLFNVPLLLFHLRLYLRKEYLVDVTEVFNQLPYEKKLRLVKLFFYLAFFVLVIYRLVEAGVTFLLGEHAHVVQAKVLGNVAGSG